VVDERVDREQNGGGRCIRYLERKTAKRPSDNYRDSWMMSVAGTTKVPHRLTELGDTP
jgi:hypothetical protein